MVAWRSRLGVVMDTTIVRGLRWILLGYVSASQRTAVRELFHGLLAEMAAGLGGQGRCGCEMRWPRHGSRHVGVALGAYGARWMLIVAAVTAPLHVTAQTLTLDALSASARIRVTADCDAPTPRTGLAPSPNRRDGNAHCARYEGVLVRLTADSLWLASDEREIPLARAGIRSMTVRSGTRGSADIGLAVGGAVGLAVGIASAVATDCTDQGTLEDLCTASQVASPFAGAAIGVGVGALVGAFVRRDRWEPVTGTGPGRSSGGLRESSPTPCGREGQCSGSARLTPDDPMADPLRRVAVRSKSGR
jgi:hypothetical protein